MGGAIVNTVMNLRVPQNVEKFLSSCELAASQEGLISMEFIPSHSSVVHVTHCLFVNSDFE
jgi:hypothetical protein